LSLVEIVGFLTGLVSVWLTVRENIWTWPIGIINSGAWAWLFFGAKLYTDAGLQFVYIALAILGWFWWLHGGEQRRELPVARTSSRMAVVLTTSIVLGTLLLTAFNVFATDTDVPFWDAFPTVLSIAAQFMLARKLFENWFLWITVDVIYIGLYVSKGLYLTASLQVVFIVLCVAGIREWFRSMADEAREEPPFQETEVIRA